MQRIADKWATWLVPVAVAIAVITGIVTYFVVGNENNAALIRAVTVLVVFCPCALVLATPTAVMAGIGQATKYGVLIKSGEAMESMGRANCIAFDKTGTLTLGKLTVSDVLTFGDISESQLLAKTAAPGEPERTPASAKPSQLMRRNGAWLCPKLKTSP